MVARPALRKIFARLAAVLGGLAMALLLVEAGVRLAGIEPYKPTAMTGATSRVSSDPVLRFDLEPGSSRSFTFFHQGGGEPRTIVHAINSLGFRGPETTKAKPEGVLRIAAIGDSYTFGHGVGNDDTWPANLQRALANEGRRYEVLNFGIPAYDTEQEVRLLRDRVLAYEPDLVLLGWYLNDPAVRDGAAGESLGDPPAIVRWMATGREGWLADLRAWSQALDVICDRLYRSAHEHFLPTTFARLYDDVHPGFVRAKLALQRGAGLCRQAGIPFAVVMYPDLLQIGDRLVSHEPYAKVMAFLAEQQIPYFDLEPAFLDRDLKALRVHAHDSHPSEAAHAIAGQAVAQWLRASGLLPR